jgi:pimeloyl-ACP methyl ester carboxylesterase
MKEVAADIYGGAFREDPSLIAQHAAAMSGAHNLGYFYQLLALAGWTSLPWLRSLAQPTLVLMGSDDPLVPPINGRILASLIPNCSVLAECDLHLPLHA